MPDEDPKLDPNRYYSPPGVTEPILRPEFVQEEAQKAAAEAAADEPSVPAKKKRAPRKVSAKVAKKK